MDDNSAFRTAFQKAKGRSEFYMDGTFVPILHADGTREWREMKVAAFVKRLLGMSALPAEWGTRPLPKPSVVVCVDCEQGGLSRTLSTGASPIGYWQRVFGIGGWGEMDLEHCS